MTNQLTKIDTFDGDFEYLHIAAVFEYGPVPSYPTASDVHLAVSNLEHDQSPAAAWNLEAIKWRRNNGGKKLDLDAITKALATRLKAMVP